ncbi:hypothetical protein ABGB12_14445 [Actinocorallia sp. B10E7]|uniref:hypothetical protein n=1 Tax=Actinocorallia sp. B10E7 TaxID=3153558 RepID=UPI00325E2482
MISEEEAAWHAEADQTFTRLLAEAKAHPRTPRSREEGDLEGEAVQWLIGIALRCEDHEYIEGWCVRLGRGLPPGHHMLGLAALCLGHSTRRFGRVSEEARALVEELAGRHRQNRDDVDARALSGLDDVDHFAPRHPRLAKITRWITALWYRMHRP